MSTKQPKLYGELASWWPLLSSPADYAEEAEFYRRILVEACQGPARSVLELGCGGGNNALYLRAHFAMTLTDRSPSMLDISRVLNPDCEHVVGDMRTLRLGRQFDGVFVHDAVCYLTTAADLRRTAGTAFVHCRPGGAALFVPDHIRENFRPATEHGGHDGAGRSLRYLMWTWDPDPADMTYLSDFAYLLRSGDGTMQVEHDRHVLGLFSRAEWLAALQEAGFETEVVPHRLAGPDAGEYEAFLGRRPGAR